MAKNKKEMTPEERLAAALVPEKEWPYALPDGWKWVRLGKIYEVNPKIQADDNIEASFITMSDICPGIKSQFDFSIKKWGEIKKGHTQFANGDVAFAKISPCFENRKSMILDGLKNGIGAGTTELIVLRNPQIDNNYTFLFISSEEFIRHARNTYKGVVGQQRINLDFVKNYPMPLPPLSEQHRLVARIESLFAKLDAAKAKVQAVLDAHETRKAALLHDAFAGKLTAKWREARGVTGDVYQSMPLADVCKSIFDGDHMPPPKSSRGIPFVVISNVNKGKLDFSETRFVPQDYYDKLTDTRKPESGDVLYTLVGTYGIPVLVDTDRAFCFQRHMALLKPNEEAVLQRYLWYALQQRNFYQSATKIAKGTAQLTVPIKGLRQLTIPMTSLPEQQEIVAILDRLLGREEEVRQSAESVLAAIDSMKQSILARAFHGELGA